MEWRVLEISEYTMAEIQEHIETKACSGLPGDGESDCFSEFAW